jgi:hypothetical protein
MEEIIDSILNYVKSNLLGIITAFVAFMSFLYSFKASKITNYVNTITAHRLKDIMLLKELATELISICYSFELSIDSIKELAKVQKKLLLHLNPIEDIIAINIIKKIIIQTNNTTNKSKTGIETNVYEDLLELCDELLLYIRVRCKVEWEKTKREVRGHQFIITFFKNSIFNIKSKNDKKDLELFDNLIKEYKDYEKQELPLN